MNDSTLTIVTPPELPKPTGFAHGLIAPAGGRVLFVAGQIATDPEGHVTSDDFLAQFEMALANVLTVVSAAGGRADHVARMTIYVTSMEQYRDRRPALADVWRRQPQHWYNVSRTTTAFVPWHCGQRKPSGHRKLTR